jgi:MFS family permease
VWRRGPIRAPRRARLLLLKHLEGRGSHQRWVLWAGLAGMFANNFTFTILAVSLRQIALELGSRETTLAWVVTAPILLSAVALPVLGKIGDLRGHRRVFLWGSGAAAIVGFATALAWDAASLIGLRTLSAVLGAATGPSSMALIFSAYSDTERTRAMGWWSMMGAGAPALGLIAGGPLVDWLGWRVLFVLQGAFAVLALGFAWAVLVETPRQRVRFDTAGATLLALGTGAVMFALSQAREPAVTMPVIWLALALAALALSAFVRTERRTPEPLLPLSFLGRANFTAPIVSGALQNGAYMGAFVLAPFVLLGVFQLSITTASLTMLLRTLTLTLSSPLGGHLGERIGERAAILLGNASVTVSMGLLAVGAMQPSLPVLAAGLVLQGLGQGIASPSLQAAVAGAVPAEFLGMATASNRLFNQVGTAFGIALLTGMYGGKAEGFAAGFGSGALLGLLSVAVALPIRSTQPPSQER